MVRLLIIAAVIALAGWLLFGRRRSERVQDDAAARKPAPPAVPAEMVACAHCGVHLPRPEAVVDGAGMPYCSPAHRDAGPR